MYIYSDHYPVHRYKQDQTLAVNHPFGGIIMLYGAIMFNKTLPSRDVDGVVKLSEIETLVEKFEFSFFFSTNLTGKYSTKLGEPRWNFR